MCPVRCFVGVALDPRLIRIFVSCSLAIRAADPDWLHDRWVSEDNLHLTLHFIGDVDEHDVRTLTDSLGPAIESSPAFDLPFMRVRATPSATRARVLWAHYADPGGACGRLASSLAAATLNSTASGTERPFIPHVTLCRTRTPHALSPRAIDAADLAVRGLETTMSVRSATLYTSRLTQRGPVYEVLARWDLQPHEGQH